MISLAEVLALLVHRALQIHNFDRLALAPVSYCAFLVLHIIQVLVIIEKVIQTLLSNNCSHSSRLKSLIL